MPEISRFLGIVIRFYYNDPLPPHFHAEYGEFRAQIAIGSQARIAGRLPGRVLGLVQEWADLHQAELTHGWDQARRGEVPDRIEPLV